MYGVCLKADIQELCCEVDHFENSILRFAFNYFLPQHLLIPICFDILSLHAQGYVEHERERELVEGHKICIGLKALSSSYMHLVTASEKPECTQADRYQWASLLPILKITARFLLPHQTS